MDIIDNVSEEIIPPATKTLTAVFHPGYYRDREKPKPHESRSQSSFYVPEHKRLVYIAGGFQGGKTKEYLDVTREISYKIDKDIKDDYEFSRKTYKDLIYTGTRSMDVLAELARESEHPRAFEVLAQTIKNIGDTTEKLMSLQKKKKDLKRDTLQEKE